MDGRNPSIASFVCLVFQTMAAEADSSGGQPYVMSQRVTSSTSFWLLTAPTTVPPLFCPLKQVDASTKHQQQIMLVNVFLFLSSYSTCNPAPLETSKNSVKCVTFNS